MNQPTTGRLLPPRVQGAHLPVIQCRTVIPLGTGRISRLIAEARGQHLPTNDPNAELPDDIKQELWDEWYEIVDEALRVLDERSTCSECGEIHYAPDTNKMVEKLRKKMNKADPEKITQDMIDEWLDEMDDIEEHYLEETEEVYDGLMDLDEQDLEVHP